VIGAITVVSLAPADVLLGFATFLISTGLFYGPPLQAQPMKAISAVILTGWAGTPNRDAQHLYIAARQLSGFPARCGSRSAQIQRYSLESNSGARA
jgi:hypothetical protein